jgi:hypothetical protein
MGCKMNTNAWYMYFGPLSRELLRAYSNPNPLGETMKSTLYIKDSQLYFLILQEKISQIPYNPHTVNHPSYTLYLLIGRYMY